MKLHERCIAGIDIDTGRWIRPVCDSLYPEDGRVPEQVRLIENKEPELLDILEIPLSDTGNDFGIENENLSVLPGSWRFLGKAQANEVLQYCRNTSYILHNSWKYVTVPYLQSLPFDKRSSLQLVRAVQLSIKQRTTAQGTTKWRGSIQTINGNRLVDASITDAIFVQKLEAGYQPRNNCLVTVSLSVPYRPDDWDGEDPCWKLIAGVIEL
ncbi:MAG: hypothetical protein WBB28_13750 [Crinalium sp.]